jgi:hypothetical protein
MADYKELLRRAVEALPENNGAARRAVYEKARAALVGQLRAINGRTSRENLRHEFADVLAWLTTLASIANVDLQEATVERYGKGCPKCQAIPCKCDEQRTPAYRC